MEEETLPNSNKNYKNKLRVMMLKKYSDFKLLRLQMLDSISCIVNQDNVCCVDGDSIIPPLPSKQVLEIAMGCVNYIIF
jgi:hypothetical protein